MRFLFCASAISSLLNDWSGVDMDRSVSYIKSCRTYEGGFGLTPGMAFIICVQILLLCESWALFAFSRNQHNYTL